MILAVDAFCRSTLFRSSPLILRFRLPLPVLFISTCTARQSCVVLEESKTNFRSAFCRSETQNVETNFYCHAGGTFPTEDDCALRKARFNCSPLPSRFVSKSYNFQAISSKFWAQGPHRVKTPLGSPDQNPGSAPAYVVGLVCLARAVCRCFVRIACCALFKTRNTTTRPLTKILDPPLNTVTPP